jgi:hypothetical protein
VSCCLIYLAHLSFCLLCENDSVPSYPLPFAAGTMWSLVCRGCLGEIAGRMDFLSALGLAWQPLQGSQPLQYLTPVAASLAPDAGIPLPPGQFFSVLASSAQLPMISFALNETLCFLKIPEGRFPAHSVSLV